MSGEAVISDDELYRYALYRDIEVELPVDARDQDALDEAEERAEATCLFVMLNPSTADATEDDPTIRRCVGFCKREGYGRLAVANLYAFRTPFPSELARVDDPVGPDNDDWIATLANESSTIVAAWGASGMATAERIEQVMFILDHGDTWLSCLGMTTSGHPRHPLYVAADQPLVDFEAEA